MDKDINIVLVDDHAIVRNGIKALLSSEQYIKIVGEASDGSEAVTIVTNTSPDLIVMDINMPVMNGLDALKAMRQNGLEIPCLILSMHESEEYVMKALDYGAAGYILKDTSKEHFLKAIKSIASGGKYFSGAISEYIVDRLMGKNKAVAEENTIPNEHQAILDELTKREKQILDLVLEGLSNKDIAEKIDKSVRTVEAHRFNLMKKMDAKNLAELITKVGKYR